ncbi:hypothetical protein TNIN_231781 [Trichonephila inaurata madagascariensis]|uniref:Uncharacterized protein n=1 Tax=Trichonephila inaurata madagascariensis TaxID=2747483 RepID=A0A8X6XIE5_9ARAC|nr:hypothetical protein TNIN_231781 [Trichonephila inaurata madagascariensis]
MPKLIVSLIQLEFEKKSLLLTNKPESYLHLCKVMSSVMSRDDNNSKSYVPVPSAIVNLINIPMLSSLVEIRILAKAQWLRTVDVTCSNNAKKL